MGCTCAQERREQRKRERIEEEKRLAEQRAAEDQKKKTDEVRCIYKYRDDDEYETSSVLTFESRLVSTETRD